MQVIARHKKKNWKCNSAQNPENCVTREKFGEIAIEPSKILFFAYRSSKQSGGKKWMALFRWFRSRLRIGDTYSLEAMRTARF